jgi:hypothetical protein
MEAFTDTVRLRALGLGARVIESSFAAELAAAVSRHAQELNIMLLEERQHTIVEQIGGRDRRLAIIELGEGDLGVVSMKVC